MTSVSLLVPWRPDGDVRDRLWAWCAARWARIAPDVEVVEGYSAAGPFRVGEALNNAASMASGDVFVNYCADGVPDIEAIEAALPAVAESGWAALFARTAFLTETATREVIEADDVADVEISTEGIVIVGCCNGPTVLHRDLWADLGGQDVRFAGWGPEDLAFRIALQTLAGPGRQCDATLVHLFHGSGPTQETSPDNQELFDRYVAANGDPAAMRALRAAVAA